MIAILDIGVEVSRKYWSIAADLDYGHQSDLSEKGKVMIVRIDQDLCTGDGLCEQGCPQVFTIGDDGYAYVKDGIGISEKAPIPTHLEDSVLAAAEECPGGCILLLAS